MIKVLCICVLFAAVYAQSEEVKAAEPAVELANSAEQPVVVAEVADESKVKSDLSGAESGWGYGGYGGWGGYGGGQGGWGGYGGYGGWKGGYGGYNGYNGWGGYRRGWSGYGYPTYGYKSHGWNGYRGW